MESFPEDADHEINGFFLLPLDMLCIVGFDGYFKRINKTWETTLGYSQQELLSAPFIDFIHPDDREKTMAEYEREQTGAGVISFENRYRCKDGSYRWLHWNAMPVTEKKLIYASARDITDRKIVEDQQRQAQKMEAIGRLAGGVAHDFNNLLTIIIGRAQMMMMRLKPVDPFRREVKLIEETAERAAALTRQLLQFSRQQVLQPKVINLNPTVIEMDEMLRRLIGENIDLKMRLSSSLGNVLADPGQIQQVVMNLAVNARDAMPNGGKVLIETTNVELDAEYAKHHASVSPGPHVMLAVTDTGCGMDEKTRSHLFEPFFTTKAKGKGTGLGLSTVYGIVKQSGGHIWVYSEPGTGATFKVYFPRVEASGAAKSSSVQPAAVERGTETILLVEDEDEVRGLIRDILFENGYTVLVAANGDEALAISERTGGDIHLTITDVVMPKMSGRDLAARLLSQRPKMKVLFMSGYTSDSVVHHGVLDEGISFLEKPFTPSSLARKVREVLALQ